MALLREIIDTEIFLFGQYGVPTHCTEALRYINLKGMLRYNSLFHEARSATYCGLTKASFHSDAAIKRALDNFELGLELIVGRHLGFVGQSVLQFELKPPHEQMPEALWYCPIFHKGLAARIGLNLHYETGNVVVTIANIQGKDKAKLISLTEVLLHHQYWTIEAIASIMSALPEKITIVRGISSTFHPSRNRRGFDKQRASCLYDRTFRHPHLGMRPIRDENGTIMYYEVRR